eukprot:CAMPEP_0202696146 /NCGR_PEP_ID=MMETSP1385-20130828/9482_1 /ASSEMBLY_ACC=CAM_ASM_000861 /TAXON_ID=933848 /ORGANISM="Elphidium margaritaceum" /LENGTH=596 /DNA_ID=CAMNT_0049352257 /DNA_START=58 /DNA_END=1848 /DNA_ORIENTATION=-
MGGVCGGGTVADNENDDKANANDANNNNNKAAADQSAASSNPNEAIDVMSLYRVGVTLGSGASCRVVEGFNKPAAGAQVATPVAAIKIMDKDRPISAKLYEREVSILNQLTPDKASPPKGVLPFVGHGQDEDAFYIVTSLLRGGELFDRIVSKDDIYKISEKVAVKLICDMLESVKYCHDRNVVHRDLKPENFVFANKKVESDIVLIDYGCARIVTDAEVVNDVVGTAYYLAPELAAAALENYSKKGATTSKSVPSSQPRTGKILKAADVWSMGVIAYVMMTGRAPFRGRNNIGIFESTLLKPVVFPDKDARYHNKLMLSDHFKDFIKATLEKDPSKRITIDAAIRHPWVQGVEATDYRLNSDVVHYLRQFKYQCVLKKEITRVLASNMTDEPSKQVLKHFKRLDADGDGFLDLDELTYLLLDMGYVGHQAKEEAKEMIKNHDVNGDNVIDFEEFKQVWYRKVLSSNDQYVHRVFDVFDDNGDGHIDSNELGHILFPEQYDDEKGGGGDGDDDDAQALNPTDETSTDESEEVDDVQGAFNATIMNMIKEVDLNGDGKIDFKEFKTAMKEDLETGKWGKLDEAQDGDYGGLIGPKIQ